MKYLRTYENYKYNTYSEILNKILNKIAEPFHGYKLHVLNHMFEKNNAITAGDPVGSKFYWVACKFVAKNKIEISGNRGIYNIFLSEKKEGLEKFSEVEKVFFNGRGRFTPLAPDENAKYGNLAKANESVYEFKIYLTKEAIEEITIEYELSNVAKQYNL